jgi:hypothetical protein|eukprot:COSAG01_NODE_525_length_15926_cov_28.158021_1_plen_69_part_00
MADQQDGATATDEKPPATDGGDGGEVSEQNLHPKLGSNPSLAKLPVSRCPLSTHECLLVSFSSHTQNS